jgi:hypothetical protein
METGIIFDQYGLKAANAKSLQHCYTARDFFKGLFLLKAP